MGQQNNSQDIQNRFTAYLQTAVKRRKRDYLKKQIRFASHEMLYDFGSAPYSACCGSSDWLWYLPESEDVAFLSQLTSRERYILVERVLKGTGYDELAKRLGLQYNSAASAYHRAIQKVKKMLKER